VLCRLLFFLPSPPGRGPVTQAGRVVTGGGLLGTTHGLLSLSVHDDGDENG